MQEFPLQEAVIFSPELERGLWGGIPPCQ